MASLKALILSLCLLLASFAFAAEDPGRLFVLQIDAFSSQKQAYALVAKLSDKGYAPHVASLLDEAGRDLYAVRLGVFVSPEEAAAAAKRFKQQENIDINKEFSHFNIIQITGGQMAALDSPSPAPTASAQPKTKKNQTPKPQTKADAAANPAADHVYSIVIGSFSSRENAVRLARTHRDKGRHAYVLQLLDGNDKTWYVVHLGRYASRNEAKSEAQRLHRAEKTPLRVRKVETSLIAKRRQEL